MAPEVHCDAWDISTKGGIEARIGILGLSAKMLMVEIQREAT